MLPFIFILCIFPVYFVARFHKNMVNEYEKYSDSTNGVFLIGEVDIDSITPTQLAEDFDDELEDVLRNDSKLWIAESSEFVKQYPSLKVESALVLGPLSKTKLPVQRASWLVEHCLSADDLFRFLISPEGFSVIDPITPLQEHLKAPQASYFIPASDRFPRDARLELKQATIPLPWPFKNREFLVLNLLNEGKRVFVSKSVYSRQIPGSSPIINENCRFTKINQNQNSIRALNSFGVRVQEVQSSISESPHCLVESYNFAYLFMLSPLNHYMNLCFYGGMASRLQSAVNHLSKVSR